MCIRDRIDNVNEQIREDGQLAFFMGPILGRPYKIYAVNAGSQQLDLTAFLLVSIPARMIRFVLLAFLSGMIARQLLKSFSEKQVICMHLTFWSVIYSFYFYHFGL